MSKPKYHWIKERRNPQIGTYFVAMGNISLKAARKAEGSLHGGNYMHRYGSKEAYDAEIEALKERGERVRINYGAAMEEK